MWFKARRQVPIRNLISESSVLRGELRFVDGLRIDGEVYGDVLAIPGSASLLVISENARVHGKVKAGHVIICGQVNGPIDCEDLLELQPKARVAGDIRYGMLEMHLGARVEGELRSSKNGDRPALKLAASNDA
jgi:cytoskeletal protein CcmA (bactofilin family)